MAFHVICLETGEALECDGVAQLFATGQEAAERARELTGLTGKKHQPRPVKDDAWQARERTRLQDGTYTRVPWDLGQYGIDIGAWWYSARSPEAEHHYAHVSIKNPGNIAFTETPEKGAADVQTTMKPGRYLARFYPRLPADDVRAYAGQFIAKYGKLKLQFAETEDDIEHVYVNGPRSCMSYAASHYDSDEHPARVYAAGDLQVAYLTSEDDEGHITSRVLCWPEKKTYGRVYGDEKIEELLSDLGYWQSDRFAQGARILKKEQDNVYIVPYIDGIYRATDCGDYLRIDADGEIDCEKTNGLSGERYTCDHCGEPMSEDESTYIDSRDERWCECCYSDHAFYCEHSNRTIACDDAVQLANGDYVSQRWFDNNGYTCDATGDCFADIDDVVILHDGTVWSRSYFEDNGHQCDHCGECGSDDWRCHHEDDEDTEDNDTPETQEDTPEPLSTPATTQAPQASLAPFKVGDRVRFNDTPASLDTIEWRKEANARNWYGAPYPEAAEYTVSRIHDNGNIDIRRDDGGAECWEAAKFELAQLVIHNGDIATLRNDLHMPDGEYRVCDDAPMLGTLVIVRRPNGWSTTVERRCITAVRSPDATQSATRSLELA